MRILIVSDTHGEGELLNQVVQREVCDHVIHCGDFCTEAGSLPRGSLTVVRGNCDWEKFSGEAQWEGGGLRFFVTHGHRFRVNSSLLSLQYRAREVGAQIACFGHTHVPLAEVVEGVLLINPGSLTEPRGVPQPSYAILETEGEGKVRLSFHTPEGEGLPKLGGSFSVGKQDSP